MLGLIRTKNDFQQTPVLLLPNINECGWQGGLGLGVQIPLW